MTRFAAGLQGFTRFLFALGLAATATAWAQNLPIVAGEPVVGAPKAAQTPGLLTTEEEMPARRVRLAAPSRAELSFADTADTAVKRVKDRLRPRSRRACRGRRGRQARVEQRGRVAHRQASRPVARRGRRCAVGLRIGATRQPWVLRVAGSDDETKVPRPAAEAGPSARPRPTGRRSREGDAQVIEIARPPRSGALRAGRDVSHVVSGPSSHIPQDRFRHRASKTCNVDVACVSNPTQALRDAANAVVQMWPPSERRLLPVHGHAPQRPPCGDQIPYCSRRTTASRRTTRRTHGAADATGGRHAEHVLLHQRRDLQQPRHAPLRAALQRGATYLHHSLSQDVLFLRLNEWGPGRAFLAAGMRTVAIGTAITLLPHPYGDLKKYTAGNVRRPSKRSRAR